MTPRLVVTAGPDKGRFFNLTASETLQVGRSQNTATRLTDPTLSRVHCEIEWNGERAVLINISSSGTLVNGHSVSDGLARRPPHALRQHLVEPHHVRPQQLAAGVAECDGRRRARPGKAFKSRHGSPGRGSVP